MKFTILFLALALGAAPAYGQDKDKTPMARVVELIRDLKSKVMADGHEEQESFDTYACWCEKTLERKAKAISDAKELIAETEILIEKLKGEIASHGAEIVQLNKDIAENKQAQADATAVRDKEYAEYQEERTESEQCIGALEAAIKVLTSATAKKGFLETQHKVQLLSVSAGLRSILRFRRFPKGVTENDIEMVKNFVAKPEAFIAEKATGMSATQVGHNPFGDYAPQSTQIQGILKGMYDAFSTDLEKDNAAEADSQKAFEALMATKQQELDTLQATLQKQEADQASKTKKLKESEVLKDDTTDQLHADEAFFADTKEACANKAAEWSVRTRLRTEELSGMDQAIKILSDGEVTFKNATTTFLQLKSINVHQRAPKAYGQLRKLATEYRSVKIARIAAMVQLGGHFDKVMVMIDDMITLLRKEEAADIVHRDLCENAQNANSNELADLEHVIERAGHMITRMENEKTELQKEIEALEEDIKGTHENMDELLKMRNGEVADFRQALKDDTDAVALIREAITALSKFYKRNNIPLNLAQKTNAPEYTEDPDKAPETSWSGSNYGGRKGESEGILAILAMLTEDLEKEIADGRKDDAEAQAKYEEQNAALQKTLDAQEQTKVTLEKEKAGLEMKISAAEEFKNGKSNDKDAEGDTSKALATDCAWVKSHFETRRQKRKNEIQGLVEAKGFLAGVDAGEDPATAGLN